MTTEKGMSFSRFRKPVCEMCGARHRPEDDHWQPVKGGVRGYGNAPILPPTRTPADRPHTDRNEGE